jgi:hypothetical protein
MEKCITVFREDIFVSDKRSHITDKLIKIFNTELPSDTRSKFTQSQIVELSERVLQSLTVVMEFMDKGIKGLLTGDLSIYMIQSIESTLEKFNSKLLITTTELEELLVKQKEANKLFKIMEDFETQGNPMLETLNDNPVRNVNLKELGIDGHNFAEMGLSKFETIREDAHIDKIRERYHSIQKNLREDIDKKKNDSNIIINDVYNEIIETAFGLDKYRVPYYGIKYPEFENPINLFQRQLKVEELSFELSHAKYKHTLESLIKIGRADQLAASHKIVLHWLK